MKRRGMIIAGIAAVVLVASPALADDRGAATGQDPRSPGQNEGSGAGTMDRGTTGLGSRGQYRAQPEDDTNTNSKAAPGASGGMQHRGPGGDTQGGTGAGSGSMGSQTGGTGTGSGDR